jgi:hypothetical protein
VAARVTKSDQQVPQDSIAAHNLPAKLARSGRVLGAPGLKSDNERAKRVHIKCRMQPAFGNWYAVQPGGTFFGTHIPRKTGTKLGRYFRTSRRTEARAMKNAVPGKGLGSAIGCSAEGLEHLLEMNRREFATAGCSSTITPAPYLMSVMVDDSTNVFAVPRAVTWYT